MNNYYSIEKVCAFIEMAGNIYGFFLIISSLLGVGLIMTVLFKEEPKEPRKKKNRQTMIVIACFLLAGPICLLLLFLILFNILSYWNTDLYYFKLKMKFCKNPEIK